MSIIDLIEEGCSLKKAEKLLKEYLIAAIDSIPLAVLYRLGMYFIATRDVVMRKMIKKADAIFFRLESSNEEKGCVDK